jgi:hypothetical protein
MLYILDKYIHWVYNNRVRGRKPQKKRGNVMNKSELIKAIEELGGSKVDVRSSHTKATTTPRGKRIKACTIYYISAFIVSKQEVINVKFEKNRHSTMPMVYKSLFKLFKEELEYNEN